MKTAQHASLAQWIVVRAWMIIPVLVIALIPLTASAQTTECSNTWGTTGSPVNIYNCVNSGNVGLGTNEPKAKLDIKGTLRLQGTAQIAPTSGSGLEFFYIDPYGYLFGYDRTGGAYTPFEVRGSSINVSAQSGVAALNYQGGKGVYVNSTNNVGIGTASPTAKLDVIREGNSNVYENGVRANRPDALGGAYAFMGYGMSSTDAYFGSVYTGDPNTYGAIHLRQYKLSGGIMIPNDVLNISTTGNVGINTTNPSYSLDVSGSIRATGDITAARVFNAVYGQDIAEYVPSTKDLQAGTVVILDPAKNNHVMASTDAYDTRVAGVVSAQPGIILGENGAGMETVATTGRVKVRVSAMNGAIAIGDLLVTSDVAGTAMKSEPIQLGSRKIHQPGTLIGKALEPLAEGEGEVLVLLSLQ